MCIDMGDPLAVKKAFVESQSEIARLLAENQKLLATIEAVRSLSKEFVGCAVDLHSMLLHIQQFQNSNPGLNPSVLIKVNGEWLPVRAGIEVTGEHRNAVAIAYLVRNEDGTYRKGE